MADTQKADYREYIKTLLQHHEVLCPDIFDKNMVMLPEVFAKLNEIAQFMQDKILPSFKNFKILDIILCGNLCGYIYNDKTDIDLAIVFEKIDGAQNLIKNINLSLPKRGFQFEIYGHRVDYGLVESFITGSNYSLLRNEWNKKPEYRKFMFDFDYFYSKYCQFDAEVHLIVKNLEKEGDTFLTMESCRILTEYLDYLKENGLQLKRHHPEHEYSLDYNIFRCMKHMGTYNHFRNFVQDSINHHRNRLDNSYENND